MIEEFEGILEGFWRELELTTAWYMIECPGFLLLSRNLYVISGLYNIRSILYPFSTWDCIL